ncbi:hypothetical protein LWI28_022933 [Acer negundo]|uniref:FLZ-type domain-containing protein n=1 Tax=Acer negundo TaxID=4023 RepID=A0AAD5J2J1_ACENE|nr:hypothetical protein LWI28_022933 [Acer negundo]
MQVKRSRVPSFDDTDVGAVLNQSSMPVDHQSHPQTDPKTALSSAESEQSRLGILTVSSLEVVKESGDGHHLGQIGNFLDKCYFCQKRLRQQDAAFMCGSLHAFCTPECRDKQIVVDKVVERVTKQPRGTGNECNGVNAVKDQSGFQLENFASSK